MRIHVDVFKRVVDQESQVRVAQAIGSFSASILPLRNTTARSSMGNTSARAPNLSSFPEHQRRTTIFITTVAMSSSTASRAEAPATARLACTPTRKGRKIGTPCLHPALGFSDGRTQLGRSARAGKARGTASNYSRYRQCGSICVSSSGGKSPEPSRISERSLAVFVLYISSVMLR
jgi:hypothetical protein